VVPVHNEAENIPILYQALTETAKQVSYLIELIFIDDGSTDRSLDVLETLAHGDKRVRIIEFARNFGKEAAVSAGLHVAIGDAVITLDADMQHPPELMLKMLKKWQNGADVVVGLRAYSEKETWHKKLFSWLFYRAMAISGVKQITPRATDYRLVDRKVVDAFKAMTERNRMTRSLLDWLGFRRKYIYFEAPPRANGQASYGFKQLVSLAINSFTSHSLLPLKFAGYLGAAILFSSGLLGVFMYFTKYIWGDPYHLNFTGTALLATLVVFLVGLVLMCMGLVAMYIARIHSEVANRPLYVVRRDTLLESEGQEL
jgi:glycosyltransferase involved in cell wall biosynthesis